MNEADGQTAAQTAIQNVTPTTNMGVRPADKPAGWTVQIFDTQGNRVEVQDIGLILGHNAKMGVTWAYGLTLGGFDGLQIHETGGGGAVIAPYCIKDGKLYVGVVEQKRHTQGGLMQNVPRGFRKPGQNPLQNAIDEFNEEVGVDTAKVQVEIYSLGGKHMNPNSAHYETWLAEEGVKFWACEISDNALEFTDGVLVFRADVLDAMSEQAKKAEGILGARFIPWQQAVELEDGFTVGITARLLCHLTKNERVTITF